MTYILARKGGTEELLNLPWYQVVVVYLSKPTASDLKSSYSKKDKLCSCFWTTVDRVVGAEGGMKKGPHIMCTVLEKQFRLFALDRFCRKSA